MRLLLAAIMLGLAGCATNEPLCRYWTDEPIGKGISDPSALPMLPYNPYWVVRNSSGSPPDAKTPAEDPCAGQPGHPGRVSSSGPARR